MASLSPKRLDAADVLAAVVRIHHSLIRFDHAFVGLAGTIVRLTHTFQRTERIWNFFERDDFLKMSWLASNQLDIADKLDSDVPPRTVCSHASMTSSSTSGGSADFCVWLRWLKLFALSPPRFLLVMASRVEERTDHVDLLDAILQVHGLLAGVEHAFVGLAGTIIRLSKVFQQTDHLEHCPERDNFLKRRWLVPNEHLLVHVKPHEFTAACQAIDASRVHHVDSAHAEFAVPVRSTYEGHQRTLTFRFDLAKQVAPPIHRDGAWPRDICAIYVGQGVHEQKLEVPAERAVYAAVRRLRPLYDIPRHEIDAGFNEHVPPPVPDDLLAFHIEWQVQLALDHLGRSDLGFLSPSAWDRDVSGLMTATQYGERAERLLEVLVASLQHTPDGDEPTNLLVWRAARQEDAETGLTQRNTSVRLRRLARLVEEWEAVLKRPYPSPHHALRRD
ncbi:hypothetical protein JCM10296v2_001546 [Rhodotorula toruloides]